MLPHKWDFPLFDVVCKWKDWLTDLGYSTDLEEVFFCLCLALLHLDEEKNVSKHAMTLLALQMKAEIAYQESRGKSVYRPIKKLISKYYSSGRYKSFSHSAKSLEARNQLLLKLSPPADDPKKKAKENGRDYLDSQAKILRK